MAVDRMLFCCKQLIASLENNNKNVENCMNEFICSVNEAMAKYEEGNISVEISQLPKTMYMFVTQELPFKIKNPAAKPKLISELKLFVNMITTILNPIEAANKKE